MASSFNRKSSSSASRAPKPTYRRASAKSKASSSVSVSSRARKATAPSTGAGASGSKRSSASADRVSSMGPKRASSASGMKGAAPRNTASARKPSVAKGISRKSAAGKTVSRKVASPTGVSPKIAHPAVKPPRPAVSGKSAAAAFRRLLLGVFATIAGALSGLIGKLGIPKPSRAVLAVAAGSLIALAVAVVVVVNSALFAATDIQVEGSAHLEQQAAQALVEVPDGTTLLNVDEGAILEQLAASPWVKDVEIERVWPHTLVITPVERQVKAIAYITADEIAWAIGEDGTWIAPVTLLVAVDAEGNEVEVGEDGSVPEGATLLSGQDAALRVAQAAGCLLLTDVPSDVSPKSGESVSSKVVLAGLEYANGFSPEFVSQIKSLSVASVEAISANLTSGVEVSLGAPENITEKERVVTKLLSQETGVTFINVREPGAYTFRSAPQ